jgi:predicted O-linked N-acetylglucosamine transferase (SPINDLY family)
MNYLEYLSSYEDIDLFLDTYPFNAGTTANDSLWMDVPILTISGQSFCSRMAGSLLNTLGMNDLICKNIEEYIQKATELSINKNIFTETLARLKNQKNKTILFDGVAYARNIELSYKAISALIKSNNKLTDIDVS